MMLFWISIGSLLSMSFGCLRSEAVSDWTSAADTAALGDIVTTSMETLTLLGYRSSWLHESLASSVELG